MAKPVNWNNVDMLTPGMKNLGNQFNARFPSRDGTSDGARGDFAHTQEKSGHNPDDTVYNNAEYDDNDGKPEIRAIDVDNDLNSDVSFQEVIDHMRRLPNLGQVIRYMIYNRKIYRAPDFNPETYTGASAHTEHGHFSGARSQASDENRTFDFKFDELGDDMALTQADIKAIFDYRVSDYTLPNGGTRPSVYDWIANTAGRNKAILNALAAIAEKVDLDPSEIAAIKAAIVIPSPEDNAAAVVEALGRVDTTELAQVLRTALSPSELEALKAAL